MLRSSLIHARAWQGMQPHRRHACCSFSSDIHDRELERQYLKTLLGSKPTELLLLLGPRDCGKTKLIRSVTEGRKKAIVLDCRGTDTTSPSSFLVQLVDALLKDVPPDKLIEMLERVRPSFGTAVEVKQWFFTPRPQVKVDFLKLYKALFVGPNNTPIALNDAYKAIEVLLAGWEKDDVYPVLVIDEVNMIMDWSQSHPKELQVFVQFLVKINKQENKCHVVLATSEYGFQQWLTQHAAYEWRPLVVGDFDQQEAREYLDKQLQHSIKLDDLSWARIFEVCGGNAGLLISLVSQVEALGYQDNLGIQDWEKVLEDFISVECDRIENVAAGGEGYSSEHFARATLALLASEFHTVKEREMKIILGGHEGRSAARLVLRSLVRVNAVSVRPFSSFPAKDIPLEAWENGKGAIVTAPSALALFCMKELRPLFEQIIRDEEVQEEQRCVKQESSQLAQNEGGAATA